VAYWISYVKKEKTESLRKEKIAKKSSEEAIKEAIRKKVYAPCNQVKLAVTKKEISEVGILDDKSRSQLKTLLSSYPKDYTFQKNSICGEYPHI
jgi:hypothetical protein